MRIRILMLLYMLVSMSLQGRVAYPIVKAGFSSADIENSVIWDFDRQSVVDEHGKAWCRQDSNLIFEAFGDCVRAYSIAGDTVFYRGYNIGRSERMLIDNFLTANYGRTGYPLADGSYEWNYAGLMTADSSRGITNIEYNHNGQPTRINYGSNLFEINTYDAAGNLLCSTSRIGAPRTRYYSAGRVFDGDSLLYSYFPGGYFDAEGGVHFMHRDYQGSVILVTDSVGTVEQHTTYYPYGEPFSEPSGQPYLFSGKERLGQSKYTDFGPRHLSTASLLWSAPDLKAHDYTPFSPYSYCAANPIGRIELDGNDHFVFNLDGELIDRIIDDKEDRIVVKADEKREVKSEPFEYGTVLGNTKVNLKGGKSADILQVRGDDDAQAMFEFLADNTNVEFTQISCGEEGDNGLNFISTSHEDDKDVGGAHLISEQLRHGYTIRSHTHNHPYDDLAASAGDLEMVKNMNNIVIPNNNIQYYLYTKPHGKKQARYGRYDESTIPHTMLNVIMR